MATTRRGLCGTPVHASHVSRRLGWSPMMNTPGSIGSISGQTSQSLKIASARAFPCPAGGIGSRYVNAPAAAATANPAAAPRATFPNVNLTATSPAPPWRGPVQEPDQTPAPRADPGILQPEGASGRKVGGRSSATKTCPVADEVPDADRA